MKILKIALATAAMAAFASTASAQDGTAYINIGVDAVEFDAYTLSGKIGYQFTKNFGVEGQAAVGIIDNEETFGNIEASAGVDSSFAAFGIARLPTAENLNIFLRGGYHFTQLSASAGTADISVDVDGFAIGAGSEYLWDGVNGVRLEYTYLDGGNDSGSNVFSLSYVRNF